MSMNLVTLLYLVASICFIQALKGLSHPTTSRIGNGFGMAGMTIAVLTTVGLIVKLSASPATGPVPVTTLKTPAGIPAAAQSSASINAVNGVSSLGFSTTVFPAATAGSIFHMAICSG